MFPTSDEHISLVNILRTRIPQIELLLLDFIWIGIEDVLPSSFF